jgi:hypothetical protein
MRSLALICAAVAVSLALAGCNPPQVVQGTVVAFDEAAQVLVLRDEAPPNDELEYSIADAKVNATPAAGDVVRIAFYEEEGKRLATRVMKISQAADKDTGGGAH